MTRTASAAAVLWAILPAALAAAPAGAQQADLGVELVATDLGGGLHMVEGRGGNLALSVGPDGAFLVDDQFAPMTGRIAALVEELGGAGTEVRFVVNTHYHGDHTGGNEAWAGRGAALVAHENVRRRLMEAQVSTFTGGEVPAAPEGAWPLLTFADGVTFHLNGHTVRVIHVAHAHTDGDSLVRFEEADVLHMGDVFFNSQFPYIDTRAGGSIDGMIAALDEALAIAGEDTRIIPGHGPLATRADLAASRDMLAVARARIAAIAELGVTVDDAIAARPLTEYLEWGGGFVQVDDFVRIAFDELSASPPE